MIYPYGVKYLGSELSKLSREYGVDSTSAHISVGCYDFQQILAKIAFVYTIGVVGIENFTPSVLEFIKTGKQEIGQEYVGCTRICALKEDFLHELNIEEMYVLQPRRPIVVRVRLFACFGGPGFRVLTDWLKADADRPSAFYREQVPESVRSKMSAFTADEEVRGFWLTVQDQASVQDRKSPPPGFPPRNRFAY